MKTRQRRKDLETALNGEADVIRNTPFDIHGLVCRRRVNRDYATNIAHDYVHHSPTGFAWGYAGSGPADLALNVLALVLPKAPNDDGVKLWKPPPPGKPLVSKIAWDLHQDFKDAFLAGMPASGGIVSRERIQEWIVDKVEGAK